MRMIDADEVFIIGMLPWECARRLIELQSKRIRDGRPGPAKTVHYFMPERDVRNTGATLAPWVQRWIAGLFGVRNWVVPSRDDSANRDTLRMYLHRYDAGGCIVLVRTAQRYESTILAYLPVAKYPTNGVLTTADLAADQTEKVRRHVLDDLMVKSRPWDIRFVRCYGPQWAPSTPSDTFEPRIWRLTRERKIQAFETEPAIAVAICAKTFEGPVVVLKHRHRSNAIDDFDRISLISEHVIAEDLVGWVRNLNGPLATDDKQAREQLWRAAGRPERLILEPAFFKVSAQRELFISCGLNVDLDRLMFRGYRQVRREDGSHLGFAVFRLDLIQDDPLDELQIVESWSSDLRLVPIDKLYQEPYVSRLNRLLRLQQGWLLSEVLNQPIPSQGDESR